MYDSDVQWKLLTIVIVSSMISAFYGRYFQPTLIICGATGPSVEVWLIQNLTLSKFV